MDSAAANADQATSLDYAVQLPPAELHRALPPIAPVGADLAVCDLITDAESVTG